MQYTIMPPELEPIKSIITMIYEFTYWKRGCSEPRGLTHSSLQQKPSKTFWTWHPCAQSSQPA